MGPRTRRLASSLALAAAAAAAPSCTTDNPAYYPPDPICAAGEYFVGQSFSLSDPAQVDILFVVDNSPGMLEKQRVLAAAMPQLVARLNAENGLAWRAGVISTDLNDDGQPMTGPAGQEGCPDELPEFVSRGTPDAAAALSCNVLLGQDGSEFEMGLASARRAVLGNADFLRDAARLVIVFFSDEDDCTAGSALDTSTPDNCVWEPDSLLDETQFAQAFAAARGAGNPVSVVAIVGPEDNRSYAPGDEIAPACSGAGEARSGNRYISVTESGRLARTSLFENICATSYVGAMERIVNDVVLASDDELCLAAPMVGSPRSVVVGDDDIELSEAGDYLVLGPTDACENGAVSISRDAHDAETGHGVQVLFCTDQQPVTE